MLFESIGNISHKRNISHVVRLLYHTSADLQKPPQPHTVDRYLKYINVGDVRCRCCRFSRIPVGNKSKHNATWNTMPACKRLPVTTRDMTNCDSPNSLRTTTW